MYYNDVLNNNTMRSELLQIERATSFPGEVMAGVTLRNTALFPPHGFSMLKAGILSQEEAAQHRAVFAESIGVPVDALQFQNQVHGTVVRRVERATGLGESDGLVTSSRGVVLCVSIADCGAVLLYDREHSAVAGLHSGWRGTYGNIVAAGIGVMRAEFSTKPEELSAYISPCASGAKYCVRSDVADLFPEGTKWRLDSEHWALDIRSQIRRQLTEQGVPPEHIEMSEGCSIADERYHSYRRDGVLSGRMVAFIGLR